MVLSPLLFKPLRCPGPREDDHVMLSDVRDVVFQRDPFDEIEARVNGSYFLFSTEPETLGRAGANLAMYATVFLSDPSVTAQAQSATNCGWRMGTAGMMLRYLEAMFHLRDTEGGPLARYIWSDQAIQQRLAYERQELFGPRGLVMFTGNNDTVVHNMHLEVALFASGRCKTVELLSLEYKQARPNVSTCPYAVDHNRLFYSRFGTVPAVLHQFDRDPMLDAVLTHHWTQVAKTTFQIARDPW